MNHGTRNVVPQSQGVPVVPEHELISPIASGAYGQVWLARNALGVWRAVKIVYRASFDHDRPFEREFAGIKAFEPISRAHEGLVDLLQVGRDDEAGYFYYVMELADPVESPKSEARDPKSESSAAKDSTVPRAFDPNELGSYVPRTLAAQLKRRGRLPLEDCIRVGLSMTEALAFLHRQKLVHRDVKPSNVIFVRGIPKLADVGLVTGVGEALSFVGTEGFIAPEGPGTPQADIYSLGILLYVLSTGKSHQDFPEPLADLTAQPNHAQWLEFDAVVHKACQVNLRERFQSAEAMHAELALLESGQSVRSSRAMQRRWRITKNLAIVVMAVGLGFLTLPWLKGTNPGHIPKPEAVARYDQGHWHYYQLTPEDHAEAFKYLTEAVKLDPKFAAPYGDLLGVYAWDLLPDLTSDQQRLKKTQEIAQKLLEIDPNLAEGHTALSYCQFLQRDWRGAEREIQLAIKANPNYPFAHDLYCFYLSVQGRGEEAEREGERVEVLEPPASARLSAIMASWPFIAERHFDRAIAKLKQVLKLDRNFAMAHSFLADCYDAQSNYVAAIEEYRTCAVLSGQDAARVAEIYDGLRQAYEAQGEQGCLRKWIELMRADEALPVEKQMFTDRSQTDLAGYYARLGEKGKALDDLEKHFDEANVWDQIKFLPLYDNLHDEPRYKALVKRAGLEP